MRELLRKKVPKGNLTDHIAMIKNLFNKDIKIIIELEEEDCLIIVQDYAPFEDLK